MRIDRSTYEDYAFNQNISGWNTSHHVSYTPAGTKKVKNNKYKNKKNKKNMNLKRFDIYCFAYLFPFPLLKPHF
jgi:hypothetical protein